MSRGASHQPIRAEMPTRRRLSRLAHGLPGKPGTTYPSEPDLKPALLLAVPISVAAGMLGAGPGFLLLPSLILVGFEPRHAAAVNALAVTPLSFSGPVRTLPRPGSTSRWRRS